MIRNLEWFHRLNIEYDTSTFDTDPFEPEPEGEAGKPGTLYRGTVWSPDGGRVRFEVEGEYGDLAALHALLEGIVTARRYDGELERLPEPGGQP